jgi:hypothetical protein
MVMVDFGHDKVFSIDVGLWIITISIINIIYNRKENRATLSIVFMIFR